MENKERQGERQVKIRPLGDKVFVMPLPAPEQVGLIYLPEKAREPSITGFLVATGKDCVEGLEVGCVVYYDPISASEILVDGHNLLVMKENSIKAFLPKADG